MTWTPTALDGHRSDITMEIFFVDAPLEGFGAVEIDAARAEGSA